LMDWQSLSSSVNFPLRPPIFSLPFRLTNNYACTLNSFLTLQPQLFHITT
jgi:hypothetical protein